MAAIALLAAAVPAAAHRTSLAQGELRVAGDQVLYHLVLSPHDMAVALGIETDMVSPVPQAAFEIKRPGLESYLAQRLRVRNGEALCPPQTIQPSYDRLPESLVVEIVFACAAPVEALRFDYRLFFDIDASHRQLGRLVLPDRQEDFLFDRQLASLSAEVATAGAAQPWLQRFGRLLRLGIEHILGGPDHVLFILALLIALPRFKRLIWVVTAFTLAHSLTLGLAWYDILQIPPRPVEIAIALSIAYVAAENILGRDISHRWMVAGGFGLVHGLGFYGALSALGLEGSDAATTLIGFNLGVELGQLLIVALAFGPVAWAARHSWFTPALRVASSVILAIALWWALERTLLA